MVLAELLPILLVEDEPTDARLMLRAMEQVGITNPIHHLLNGEEMLAYLHGLNRFSDRAHFPLPILILLDLKLPDMSGFQLLNAMHSAPKFKVIPVVVLTGMDDDTTIRNAYAAGANSFLTKAFEEEEILKLAKSISDYWLQMNRTPAIVIDKRKAAG